MRITFPVEVRETRWSDEQEAIFAWFTTLGANNCVVRARAGTGKTTTIIEGISRAPEESILLAAFNKTIAEELQSRLTNPKAEAKTLHALGFSFLRRHWSKVKVDANERAWGLAHEACGRKVPDPIVGIVKELHTKAREILPLAGRAADGEQQLVDLALRFDLDVGEEWEAEGWTLERVALLAQRAMLLAEERTAVIDFADMIFLPLVHGWVTPKYDLVVVDEAQDMTEAQLSLATKACRGRICIVGDDRQCQPAGTLVRRGNGRATPIEQLQPGDAVATFDRHSGAILHNGTVTEVAHRAYDGPLYTITAGHLRTRCTASHKWLVRWTARTTNAYVTYLMRRGQRYRVGQCRLFRAAPTATARLNFGLGDRARVERADAAWILSTHPTAAEACIYEQVISARYGLPQMVFHPPSVSTRSTREAIDAVYGALGDLTTNAVRCLAAHGRAIEFPIYAKPRKRQGRRTLFETQACNLLPGFMAIPTAAKTTGKQAVWHPVAVSQEPFKGVVYSLNVEKHHKYIADGLVTCNSIYAFRGADSGSLDRLKAELKAVELGLKTTYRCPQRVVELAAAIVPDFRAAETAPEGLVDDVSAADMLQEANEGDFILSRTNAPLVPICLAFLKAGKRARIRGRDIGGSIQMLLRKLEVKTLHSLPQKLNAWYAREEKRAKKMHANEAETHLSDCLDRKELVLALAEDLVSWQEFEARCASLFSDSTAPAVTCSTIHRAKGLEADRVFLLGDTLREGNAEEGNIKYVGITRAKAHLSWSEWPKGFRP